MFWRHPFRWWVSDVMLNSSKSVQMKKLDEASTDEDEEMKHLHLKWPEGEYNFCKLGDKLL